MTALLVALAFAAGVVIAYHLGIETGRCCPDTTRHGETADERWQT
jgi:UPF0716 family protein affecting phage T7 exclusion